MTSVDWEEVKRLAADFQRAQLSSSAQRLSERNCIEIISRLLEEKLLEVIFTTDGKEYITPQHLTKEIKDELFVSGGRINIVDIAKNLSVDLHVVTKRAAELDRVDSSLRIINGQIITNDYISSLCIEINDKLAQQGQITIGDLTSNYDLPGDFLLNIVEKNLGKRIFGIQDKQDPQIIFTHEFIERNHSIVRGALSAITRPISIATLIGQCGVPERLFFSAVDSLSEKKELPGVLTSRQRAAGSYVPYIYTKSQLEWVNNFYQQNGYLEYQAMARLGISDPSGFIQKNIGKSNVLLLPTVAVGAAILDQVEAAVDEAVASASFVKLLQIMPSNFEETDIEAMLQKVLQKKGPSFSQTLHFFNSTAVVTDHYMRGLIKHFDSVIENTASDFVQSGRYIKAIVEKNQLGKIVQDRVDVKADRKEERRRKAAEGKSGGGAQGRETKTKSTKKKYLKGKAQPDDSDDEIESKSNKVTQKIEIIGKDVVLSGLKGIELFQDEDDDNLIEEVTEYLQPLLNRKAIDLSRTIFESTIASTNVSRKKKHAELQEKLSDMLLNLRLFEKGIKQFENADVAQQLTKYLLKSICNDVVNEIFLYVAHEHSKLFEDSTELTIEQRNKVLVETPADMKESLVSLNKSLNGTSIEEFLNAAEVAVGPGVTDIMVVKHDRKRERPQMLHLRQQLIEQLNMADDPALVLHLTTLILFQAYTQNVVHASGKFVSNILTVLQSYVTPEVFEALRTYHDLVLQYLTRPNESSAISSVLQEKMPTIKEIATSAKKNSAKGKERINSNTSQ